MNKHILLVGDRIADLFIFCESKRLCPEAPVPVLVKRSQEHRDGGAALVELNLRSLGNNVEAVYGTESLKERYFVGNHLVCRIDDDHIDRKLSTEIHRQILRGLEKQPAAIVISDYCKGTIDFNIAKLLTSTNLPCFVDTKNSHIEWFRGSNVTLFPNQQEYENCVKGKEHLFGTVVAKMGERGCQLWDSQSKAEWISTARRETRDVTGAGDCFLAAFVTSKLRGHDNITSATFANEAAGISVEHLGTYMVKPDELHTIELAGVTR